MSATAGHTACAPLFVAASNPVKMLHALHDSLGTPPQPWLDMYPWPCRIISEAFSSDKLFQNVLNNSFEHFINLNQRSPEYISLFMDDRLRRGPKGMNEDETEDVLDKVGCGSGVFGWLWLSCWQSCQWCFIH